MSSVNPDPDRSTWLPAPAPADTTPLGPASLADLEDPEVTAAFARLERVEQAAAKTYRSRMSPGTLVLLGVAFLALQAVLFGLLGVFG